MAYYDPNEDPLNPNAPQASDTGPQSGVISGQGSTPTQSSAAPSNTPAPDKPGNFVGIQQYLEQNKPQSAKLASDVGSYVQAQGDTAKNALTEGQNQFDQAVGQNTVTLDDNLFKQAKETPEQVDADADKKAQFQKMRDAQYQGPSSLESDTDVYQPINVAIQNALGAANNTQTAIGRSQLLGDLAKQKNQQISRGASNLDAALLSASPDSRTILSQARDQITPLQDQMKAVTDAENMKAQAAADQTAKTQQAIRDAFSGPNGVQGQLEANLQARAQQTAQQAGSDANAIMSALRTGNANLNDHQLQILGISRNQYNSLLNDQKYYQSINKSTGLNDLSSYATQLSPDNEITPQNIATPEDYARYAALNDLMGTSNGFLNDPSLAGKANPDLINFDYASTPIALQDRINNIKFASYNPAVQGPQTSINVMDNYDLNRPDAAVKFGNDANDNAHDPAYFRSSQDMLSQLKTALSSINQAYGLKLQVPDAYFNKADSLIGQSKSVPDSARTLAIQKAAYLTYLHDLQRDPGSVRKMI